MSQEGVSMRGVALDSWENGLRHKIWLNFCDLLQDSSSFLSCMYLDSMTVGMYVYSLIFSFIYSVDMY